MSQLLLHKLHKSYGSTQVLHDVSMDVEDGEFVVIVGPSGCGKSSLLRMVAGLETVSAGDIVIGQRRVNDLEPAARNIAMVFQNYALYPHMSVRQNMSYGLRISGMPASLIEARVNATAATLGLTDLLDRKPRALSGGQRQRVAMGRAIVREPAVFLFDEPLSNLDAQLRVQMRIELELLHQRLRTTSLYVTHDQVEAMTLADRVMVLNAGRIEQIGTPQEIYKHPATLFVAGFIGQPPMNLLRVARNCHGKLAVEGSDKKPQAQPLALPHPASSLPDRLVLGIRPEHLHACAPEAASATVRVRVLENLGADAQAYCDLNGQEIVVRLPDDSGIRGGDLLPIRTDVAHLHYFDPSGGRRIAP